MPWLAMQCCARPHHAMMCHASPCYALLYPLDGSRVRPGLQLVLEVHEQLKKMFSPDVRMIKKRIEDLISREYLERDPVRRALYPHPSIVHAASCTHMASNCLLCLPFLATNCCAALQYSS